MKFSFMTFVSRNTLSRMAAAAIMTFFAAHPAVAEEDALISLLAPRAEEQVQQEVQELRIEKAVYGDLPSGGQKDVTEIVAAHVTDGTLVIQASNNLFGDPARGVVKQLKVTYVLNGHRDSAIVDENQELRLGQAVEGDVSWQMKFDACRRLRRVGTERSIPVLVALLQDDSLFDVALEALETLPYPEVDEALRAALDQYEGRKRIGVMQVMGVRRDTLAVPMLADKLRSADMEEAAAAMGALGRIGTPRAAEALMSVRDKADESLRSALADGLLAAATRLIADRQLVQAAQIGAELRSAAWPEHVRPAGFRIQMLADQRQSLTLLLEALDSDNPVLRGLAAQLVAEESGELLFARYAEALEDLPVDGQLALINALTDAGRKAGRPVVIRGLRSPHSEVRVAASDAMGRLGTGEDVPRLVALLSSDDSALAVAAQHSLVQLNDPDAEGLLVNAMAGSDPEVCAKLLQILVRRGYERAVPIILDSIRDDHAVMRVAALHALADRGAAEHAPALLAALQAARDDAERQAAGRCLAAFSTRFGAEILPGMREALPHAGPRDGAMMLVALSRIGGADALELLLPMLSHEGASLRDAAERVLVGWPDMSAAPHLLSLADTDQVERRTAALRGYVRLARMETDMESRAGMLVAAMEKARRPEEKWPILGAWGTVHKAETLAHLTPYLQDAATRNEAAAAMLAVAREVLKQGDAQAAEAVNALEKLSEQLGEHSLGQQTRELLTSLDG